MCVCVHAQEATRREGELYEMHAHTHTHTHTNSWSLLPPPLLSLSLSSFDFPSLSSFSHQPSVLQGAVTSMVPAILLGSVCAARDGRVNAVTSVPVTLGAYTGPASSPGNVTARRAGEACTVTKVGPQKAIDSVIHRFTLRVPCLSVFFYSVK